MPEKVNLARLRKSAEASANDAKRKKEARFGDLDAAERYKENHPNDILAENNFIDANIKFKSAQIQYKLLDDLNQAINNATLTLDKTYTSDADIKAQQQVLEQVQAVFNLRSRMLKLAELCEKLNNGTRAAEIPEINNSLKQVIEQYSKTVNEMKAENVTTLNINLQKNLVKLHENCNLAEKACQNYVDNKVVKADPSGSKVQAALSIVAAVAAIIVAVLTPFTIFAFVGVAFAYKAYRQSKQVITGETNESRDEVSFPREIQSNIKDTLKDLKSVNPVQTKEDPDLDETTQGHMAPT